MKPLRHRETSLPATMNVRMLAPVVMAAVLLAVPVRGAVGEDAWPDHVVGPAGDNWRIPEDSGRYERWGYDTWDDAWYDVNYWGGFEWYDGYSGIWDEEAALDSEVLEGPWAPDPTRGVDRERTRGIRSGPHPEFEPGQNFRGRGPRARLTGDVEGVRQMNLRGPDGAIQTYTLARVRLENGRSTVLALGPGEGVHQMTLSKGDQVEAIGRRGEVGGATVFVAERLQAGGNVYAVHRALPADGRGQRDTERERDERRSSRQTTVRGTVESFERLAAGTGRAHTLLRVALENGRTATLDLGPDASLNRIDLQSGDRITARGRFERLGERNVLRVTRLRIENNADRRAAE